MPPTAPLDFWFEFASTYSYLSVMRIEALARRSEVEVRWRPFLLGPVFLALGWNDSPFNIYPPKGRYMWRDLQRLCAREGLPLQVPSKFPRNGLLAARIALYGAREPWLPAFARAVMTANFAEDQDISQTEVLTAILTQLELPAQDIINAAQSPENKDALRRQTEEAGAIGLFGAPSFVVDGEIFWGNDRLEDALAWARGEGRLPPR